jgi:hypothetical protein
MKAVWVRSDAAKPQHTHSANHNHHAHHAHPVHGHIARRHTGYRHKVAQLIALYSQRGLDPKVLRQVAALATDKGMRKLAHGLA